MFVVDFIAAFLLAFVLTIGFAAIVRSRRYTRLHELSQRTWLMCVASWAAGILVLGFGPMITGTHWLPFAATGLIVGLLVLPLPFFPKFRRSVHTETGEPGGDVRQPIAFYFFITLLLLFCAISLRFYLVNLA